MYELAGAAGVDPGPRTFRELVYMATGRSKADWQTASAIVAAIWSANANFEGIRVHDASESNPHVESERPHRGTEITADNLDLLSAVVGR